MDLKKNLGRELASVRTDILKMTQKEISEKVGISVVYVSYIEMGKKVPSFDLIEKIYALTQKKEIPENVRSMVNEIKEISKKELTESKIKRLLDDTNSEPSIVYDMLESLMQKGRVDEAKNYILKSIITIQKPQERKLLEALYYELEGNFPIAIRLIKEAMEMSSD